MIVTKEKYYLDFLKKYYRDHGFQKQELNIFGIRNNYDMDKDIINDVIGIWKDDIIYLTKGTTDPSVYWTQNPMNKDGALHLCVGFHKKMWRVKKHRGKYKALCNDWTCKKQRVWRDTTKNYIIDEDDTMDIGHFGANLHHMGEYERDTIGKYSAGCQVVKDIEDFETLMDLVYNSKMYKKNPLPTYFNYQLFIIHECNSLYHKLYPGDNWYV